MTPAAKLKLIVCLPGLLAAWLCASPSLPWQPGALASEGSAIAAEERLQYKPYELVLGLAWSPDGQILAAAAGETIYLYGVQALGNETPAELARLEGGVWSTSLAFSPDGRWLAAGGRDGFVRLWAVPAEPGAAGTRRAPEAQFPAHRKGTNAVRFSPDGALLASAGNDGMARLWNLAALLEDKEAGPEPEIEMIGGSFAVPAIGFTPDGASLAIGNANVIRIRDIASGRFAQTLQREGGEAQAISFYSLAVSTAGDRLAAGDTENGIYVWDLASGAQLPAPAGHSGQPARYPALVWGVAFSPDGSKVASAGGDQRLRLWETDSGIELANLGGHTDAVTCLAFSPDGRWLASGSLDATVRFWKLVE
jgi:WD40 repeat protein